MDSKLKQAWLDALRSGAYRQTKEELADANGFCCLGVLCDVASTLHALPEGVTWDGDYLLGGYDDKGDKREEYNTLPPWCSFGIYDHQRDKLANMNDGRNEDPKSFVEIADWIEQNIPTDDPPAEGQGAQLPQETTDE